MVMRKITKSGLVDPEGYLLDESGTRVKKYDPFKLDLRDYNIVQTYYWFYDLQGRLKQELFPPSDYKGTPRAYVKEDIEENRDNNTVTSHLRYYVGKKLIAYYSVTLPEFNIRFIKDGYEDAESRVKIKQSIRFMLDGGWEYYKVETRRRKITPPKLKRRSPPTKSKKIKKVVSKKRVIKKRK